jgi:hypothetical protein
MSATSRSDAFESCHPTNQTPVAVDATTIAEASRGEIRTLADDLADEGYVPATVVATAEFGEDCSLDTQREANRLRDLVATASFLGANRLTVEVEHVESPAKARPALSAVAERANREGLTFEVDGLALN